MRVSIAVACLSLCLGGCYGWEQRHGLDPVLDPAAVELATSNQLRILNALAVDAQIAPDYPGYWYEVTQAGFNFVDDECKVYFNAIFFLNRDKDQIKAGLTATGATTAAILGVTGASAKSIAIVAQAFGLGVIGTELVAGTYLYQMPPAVAQGFVKELQLGYRDGAASRRDLIKTPTAAYHAIQDYLSLCLPPTIEAKIAEHVAGARAIPDPKTGNGNSSFGLTTVTPPPVTRVDVKQAIIGDVDVPMKRFPTKPLTFEPTRLTDFERGMSKKDIMALQAALCVTPDGNLGAAGSSTRLALDDFIRTIPPADAPPPPTGTIVDKRMWSRFLVKLINKPPACSKTG